jgi:hypothetical protein
MDDQRQEQQLERFGEAVERKREEAERRSRESGAPEDVEPVGGVHGDQESLIEDGRTQDVRSPRDKNSGHGKKTADKWNQ